MALHAIIGPHTLKSFTKTLTCLSRYGDDVVIQATPGALTLSATNSAKSAHFRVKFLPTYFDKYKLKHPAQPGATQREDGETLSGQVLVKSILTILKHRTVEKTVDRCDLSIVEGGTDLGDVDARDTVYEDSLSSKLILRLHCKHGVVKTHSFFLFMPHNLNAPVISDTYSSHLVIGPDAMRDLLDHFPQSRGDPQLAWEFAADTVVLRSVETGRNSRDRSAGQVTTEISLGAEEFDTYSISDPPASISFHLREFNAAVTLAEILSVPLKMNFNLSGQPVTISFDSDTADAECLAMISTNQRQSGGKANILKRTRGHDNGLGTAKKIPRTAANMASTPPTTQAASSSPRPQTEKAAVEKPAPNSSLEESDSQPLFLPGASQDLTPPPPPPPPASQLPASDLSLIRSAGLGIEHMDYEEFEAMMEADGEEVVGGASDAPPRDDAAAERMQSDNNNGDYDMHMEASQAPLGKYGDRQFRPLFDD